MDMVVVHLKVVIVDIGKFLEEEGEFDACWWYDQWGLEYGSVSYADNSPLCSTQTLSLRIRASLVIKTAQIALETVLTLTLL